MTERFNIPSGVEWNALLAGGLVWSQVAATRSVVLGTVSWWALAAVPVVTVTALRLRRLRLLFVSALLAGAAVSGIGSGLREANTLRGVPVGTEIQESFRIVTDVTEGRWGGGRFVGRSSDGLTLVFDSSTAVPAAGQQWMLSGPVTGPPGRWRGSAHAGVVDVGSATLEEPGGPIAVAANRARARVAATFAGRGSAGGLVAGFLIGETSSVAAVDLANMRASGLSHFVAVSGSNVALFLGLWWIATFFTGLSVRARAVVGTIGLVLFVWITRWEPSVVRAASMAGLMLVSRAAGLALTGWTALGTAVGGVALVSGELVDSVGFQLSVAATCGVMAGHRLIATPLVGPLVSAALSAQVAVAPLLLVHFGSVPLVSPLANLGAVPLVTGATALGVGAAVLVSPALADAAGLLSGMVLEIAEVSAGFPQLDARGVLLGSGFVAGWRWAPVRVLAVGVALISVAWFLVRPPPIPAGIVVLDVGQGDSILLLGDEGGVVLVDGGPEETVIVEKLREYAVDRIDLMVNTHPHHDHVAGLVAAAETMPVGLIWRAGFEGEEADSLAAVAGRAGIPVVTPQPGTVASIGGVHLEVLGPVRRYVSPNDQSVVMIGTVNGVTIALVGDIETHAQADLGPVRADILKVPHQGAATSDLDWIRDSAGALSIVSVGPNQFGHPSEEVMVALVEAGSTVLRTDEIGDLVVRSRSDVPER